MIGGRNEGHLSLVAIATTLNYKVCTQLQKLQFPPEVLKAENNRQVVTCEKPQKSYKLIVRRQILITTHVFCHLWKNCQFWDKSQKSLKLKRRWQVSTSDLRLKIRRQVVLHWSPSKTTGYKDWETIMLIHSLNSQWKKLQVLRTKKWQSFCVGNKKGR